MKRFAASIFIILFLVFSKILLTQDDGLIIIKGEISFISSQNIYVKYENTKQVEVGDTLFIKVNGEYIPAIKVQFLSSVSAAGPVLNELKLKINDEVFAFIKKSIDTVISDTNGRSDSIKVNQTEQDLIPIQREVKVRTEQYLRNIERINGRFSIQSYSNISNSGKREEFQRWRYSFSLNADNISNSTLSISSYITFAYRADEWKETVNSIGKGMKVYDLSLKYGFSDKSNLQVGRGLNRRISNIGSVDGVQFVSNYNNFYGGLIAGSRPDTKDYGYNIKLFQYGGFVGRSDTTGSGIIENSLGFFQQTNNFITDRRFLYIQHTNSAIEKTFFMLSAEFDLYKKINENVSNTFSFTSLFLSARYSPNRIYSFSLSYDARKNVLYYETYKNFIDSLFENETRQGLRIGTNIKPLNNLFIGINAGYRYSGSDPKPSGNIDASVSYTNIPFIESTSTFSYSYLSGSYVNGSIFGIRLSKYLYNPAIDFALSFRKTAYHFPAGGDIYIQNSIGADAVFSFFKPVYFTISYEGIFQKQRTNGRIFIDVTTRL